MLSILTKKQCARCLQCCFFESYDLWETPSITDETMELIKEHIPGQRFSYESGRRLMVYDNKLPDSDIYLCPLLDEEKGCILGDKKPFECRIFPFKIMRYCGRLVIVISPICPEVMKLPMSELNAECKRLSGTLFAEARREPQYIRQYEAGYPILAVENERAAQNYP